MNWKNKQKMPASLIKKRMFSDLFFICFLIFSCLAVIISMRGTNVSSNRYHRGLDVIFAIDVSRSMDIRDTNTFAGKIELSRLEQGLLTLNDTVANVSGSRFAAAIGRGRGYLSVPLTWDNEAILGFLETLDSMSITGRSTNLESLITAAADSFQDSSAAHKVIVLVSDGESLSGVIRNAINRCVKDSIIIITVSPGSDEGKPVPPQSSKFDQSSGIFNEIPQAVSKRESSVMRLAAEKTGGIYIDGNRNDASTALSAQLNSIAKETNTRSGHREPKGKGMLFIILAILSYGTYKFIPFFRKKKLLFSLVVFSVFFSSCQDGKLQLIQANYLFSRGRYDEAVVSYYKAGEHPKAAAYAQYGLGLTYYMLDDYKAALNRYNISIDMIKDSPEREHRELRYRNYYNLGILYFEQDNFEDAASAFKEALKIDLKRIEAKYNLELCLLSILKEKEKEKNNIKYENKIKEYFFEYLQQEEQNHWKSREWTIDDTTTEPDY